LLLSLFNGRAQGSSRLFGRLENRPAPVSEGSADVAACRLGAGQPGKRRALRLIGTKNGDVLIKRKPAAPAPLPAPLKEGEVEL
jgi:hypothetical protein